MSNNNSNNSNHFSVDAVCEEDLLQITPYIDGMAEFIKDCETPITISIQGDWGSGKSTFANLLKKHAALKNTKWVFINTWQLSVIETQQLFPYIIMNQIINQIDKNSKESNAIKNQLTNFIIAALEIKTGKDLSRIQNLLKGNSSESLLYDSVNSMAETFKKAVNRCLKEDNKDRIIIFIDDLDRLDPAIALDLLEKLKNFFTCENCVYLLAIDESVVKQGVTMKYKGLIDAEGAQKRDQFFEKIIQVPFNLPVESYDIDDLIKNISDTNNENYKNIIEGILQKKNPRNIKRLLNLHKLYSTIFKDEQIEKDSLLALLALQIKDKKQYMEFINNLPDYDENDNQEEANTLKLFIEKMESFGVSLESLKNASTKLRETIEQQDSIFTNDYLYLSDYLNTKYNSNDYFTETKPDNRCLVRKKNGNKTELVLTLKAEENTTKIYYYYFDEPTDKLNNLKNIYVDGITKNGPLTYKNGQNSMVFIINSDRHNHGELENLISLWLD